MLVWFQLSIYPEPEREIVVVDAPSVLETQIGVARRAVTGVARDVHGRVHGTVSEWIGIEHAVERACSSFTSHPLSTITVISTPHPIFLSRPRQGPHRPRRAAHARTALRGRSLAKRVHPRAQPRGLHTRAAAPRAPPPLLQLLFAADGAERRGVRRRARGAAFSRAGAEARRRGRALAHGVGARARGGQRRSRVAPGWLGGRGAQGAGAHGAQGAGGAWARCGGGDGCG